jgi:hypothetical protein
MIKKALAAATLAGSLWLAGAGAASAEVYYPWCVTYGGGRNGIGATSCAFVSRAQCRATAMGAGAMCSENPASPPVEYRVHKRHDRPYSQR